MRRQFVWLRQQPNLVQRTPISTLEPITGRKSETAIERLSMTLRHTAKSKNETFAFCLLFVVNSRRHLSIFV